MTTLITSTVANAPIAFPFMNYAYPGAKWWKMDFHTHTPASFDYKIPDQSPEDWLKMHMAAGLDAVVVTDHNTTAFIPKLQKAYEEMDRNSPEFRTLHIFPGVELSMSDGLHLLAVFDPKKDLDDVSAVIGKCGYKGKRGETNYGLCEVSHSEAVKIIKDCGGLSIAAHIDEPCGLLWMDSLIKPRGREYRDLRNNEGLTHQQALQRFVEKGTIGKNVLTESLSIGQPLIQILEAGLNAVEVRNWSNLPEAVQDHPQLALLARVNGSDSHHPKNIGRNGFSMVHMTEPNLEGLRTAFTDGSPKRTKDSLPITGSWSVRPVELANNSDWNQWPKNAIEKISIEKIKSMGRAAPLVMPLHPKLNVIIGGRGSGKSTVINALRLATQRGAELPGSTNNQPDPATPAWDFWQWARKPEARGKPGVISEGTVVKVLYRAPSQSFELEWKDSMLNREGWASQPPIVRAGKLGTHPTEDGGAYSFPRFPLSIYSQKQVLELARRPRGLMNKIDEEKRVSDLYSKLNHERAAYSATRSKIRELQIRLVDEARDSARLKDITNELSMVESEVFKEYQSRLTQSRALLPDLNSDFSLKLLADSLDAQADQIHLPSLEDGLILPTDIHGNEAAEIYREAQSSLANIAKSIRIQAQGVRDALMLLDEKVKNSDWAKAFQESKEKFEALTGEEMPDFDPSRIEELTDARTLLLQRMTQYEKTRSEIAIFLRRAEEQLSAINATRLEVTRVRTEFITNHNRQDTLLKLTIIPMGSDISRVEESLREALGIDSQAFASAIAATENRKGSSLMDIFSRVTAPHAKVENVRARIIELIDSPTNMPGFVSLQENLRRQLASNPARREVIETWFPEDELKVEYRTAESGEWKSISEASIGQKTAAILSFLLSFGKEPLVLDQPEDDLDTRMIMQLIVEKVRCMKSERQIIIVTHNPNIVVHGDADLVHAMSDDGKQIRRDDKSSGGLQQDFTRQFICDVMEGGAIAFKRRYERMGAQKNL